METRLQRRRRLATRNWDSMSTDILCSIFTRLPYVDLLRIKSICWGWNAAVDLFKSCSATPSFQETPWLIFTPMDKYEFETCPEGTRTGTFVNIEEKKTYPFNDLAVKKMNDGGCSYCIGSSHDWLICLDGKALPYLLNPFTSHIIDLPRMHLSQGVEAVYDVAQCCARRKRFVKKSALSSSPSLDKNYYLVIIRSSDHSLAFCKDGDSSWTELHCNPGECYNDIIFHENQLYGLYGDYSSDDTSYHIRVWNVNQDEGGFLLVKNIDIVLEELIAPPPLTGYVSYLMETYLVESQGTILFVTRFDMNRSGNVFNRKTVNLGLTTSQFIVFKLGADQKFWREVTSLSGFSLFLGRNQSITVDVRNCKMLKQDVIYFNPDHGHFSGVFSLKHNSFRGLYGSKIEEFTSGPIWVVPLMKRLN